MLQSCIVLAVGGAAAGTAAYLGRQPISTYYKDSNIRYTINQRIKDEASLKENTHIIVAVYEGVVLLAGQVISPAQRIKVQQLANGIPGIKRIYNEITVSGPTSTLTRSSDAVITSRVKSEMLLQKQLKSRNIKIITENGVVYLMGEVTQQQASLASNTVRRTSGVQRVVTLFEIR